jgi:hypothetical protein
MVEASRAPNRPAERPDFRRPTGSRQRYGFKRRVTNASDARRNNHGVGVGTVSWSRRSVLADGHLKAVSGVPPIVANLRGATKRQVGDQNGFELDYPAAWNVAGKRGEVSYMLPRSDDMTIADRVTGRPADHKASRRVRSEYHPTRASRRRGERLSPPRALLIQPRIHATNAADVGAGSGDLRKVLGVRGEIDALCFGMLAQARRRRQAFRGPRRCVRARPGGGGQPAASKNAPTRPGARMARHPWRDRSAGFGFSTERTSPGGRASHSSNGSVRATISDTIGDQSPRHERTVQGYG